MKRYSEEKKGMWIEDWKGNGSSLWVYAKANGLEPFRYLYALFLCCPLITDEKEWADLLPWNIKNSENFGISSEQRPNSPFKLTDTFHPRFLNR